MDYEDLHTSSLEQSYGILKGQIIKQDKNIRIIHLLDKDEISRTLGVVRFFNFNKNEIKVAHTKIVSGDLIGKTLHKFRVDFDKVIVGTFEVKLPNWLKKDFNTSLDKGLVVFSKILIVADSLPNSKFLYSELIEVVPSDLGNLMDNKIRPLLEFEDSLLYLCEASGLTIINKSLKR